MRFHGLAMVALFAVALVPAGADAKDRKNADRGAAVGAEVINQLIACRATTDGAARLACFDKNAAALGAAIEKQDVVVVDREKAQETRRKLFGFAIPDLGLFGPHREGAKQEDEEIKEFTGTVDSARRAGDGSWIVVVKDGGVWRQTDAAILGLSPKNGNSVVIKRAALGSYVMRVEGRAGFKVRREQ